MIESAKDFICLRESEVITEYTKNTSRWSGSYILMF